MKRNNSDTSNISDIFSLNSSINIKQTNSFLYSENDSPTRRGKEKLVNLG
jgi:hypothetical protein